MWTTTHNNSRAQTPKGPLESQPIVRALTDRWFLLPNAHPGYHGPRTGQQLIDRLERHIERLCPGLLHGWHRRIWERKWSNPTFEPFWRTSEPQKEIVEAIESGWFPKAYPVVDLGCGGGEVSRWLCQQGFIVLGLDYSMKAIESCRRLSVGLPNPAVFEVVDLCREDLRPRYAAASVIDRGCFHRIVEKLRPIFAGMSPAPQWREVTSFYSLRRSKIVVPGAGIILAPRTSFVPTSKRPSRITSRSNELKPPLSTPARINAGCRPWLFGWFANPNS